MSGIKVGDLVRCIGACPPYFAVGDVGQVVQINHDVATWYKINFADQGNKVVYGDGLWEAQDFELELKPATPAAGHSGVHDGLQQHSVGACYPLHVVTYGHDPAIHVIENLTTGAVACFTTGVPRQWLSAQRAFDFLSRLIGGYTGELSLRGPVVWIVGRPKYDKEARHLRIPAQPSEVKQHVNKLRVKFAESLEASRIGRPLTEYEVYQLACDLDNR